MGVLKPILEFVACGDKIDITADKVCNSQSETLLCFRVFVETVVSVRNSNALLGGEACQLLKENVIESCMSELRF